MALLKRILGAIGRYIQESPTYVICLCLALDYDRFYRRAYENYAEEFFCVAGGFLLCFVLWTFQRMTEIRKENVLLVAFYVVVISSRITNYVIDIMNYIRQLEILEKSGML